MMAERNERVRSREEGTAIAGEVFFMLDGRIVRVDLEAECGYAEVDWDEEEENEEGQEQEAFVRAEAFSVM